jgi:DNA-binding MarR family transcriptional regulator
MTAATDFQRAPLSAAFPALVAALRIGIDRTSVGQLVDQLEAKRLVERRVTGVDRRSRLLRLTRMGEKLYRRVCPPKRGPK